MIVGSNITNASSPTITHKAHSGGSPISVFGPAAEPIGSGIVAPGEIQQFALGIRKPALGRDAAKPVREFVVMPPGIG